MSVPDSTGPLASRPQPERLPRYLTANAAVRLTGVSPQTVRLRIPPDALLVSVKGDKTYPAWLESTLTSWAAERAARLPGGAA
jgi:hypothetical protein